MANEAKSNDNVSANSAPVFITQEQFEASQNKLVESFKNAHLEAINKLTEQLKIVIPAPKPEPSAPVAASNPAPTREQIFNQSLEKVTEWFKKVKSSPAGFEIGGMSWSIPMDLMMKRMGYNYDADLQNYKATEDVTFNSGTKMTKYVKRFIMLKGGRFATPVRQYVDFQPLEDGQTAQWYTFDAAADFGAVSVGSAPTAITSTIDKVTAQPSIRGLFQKVGYDDIEMAPAPLVDAINQMAVVGALVDESKDLLNTVVGAATPATNHWVNGNDGTVITSALDASGKSLKVKGIQSAKRRIIDSVGDPAIGNLVCFLSTQQYQELLLDAVTYTQYTRASEIDNYTLEQIAGVELVQTNNIVKNTRTTNNEYQAVLAVKGIAFGMTSGRDLAMEASRRNELQQVFLTANQRVKSAVLNSEAWARISTTAE